MPTSHAAYTGSTTNMLVVPEVSPHGETSGSVSSAHFPITTALCAISDQRWEWVPEVEAPVVPVGMALMCQGCPGRSQCLMWAVGTKSDGYWAGSTRADREELLRRRSVSIDAVDVLQRERKAVDNAQHPPGVGSLKSYRAGCKCHECRRLNAARTRRNRTRAKGSEQCGLISRGHG